MTFREDIAVLYALKTDHSKSVTALTAINDGISALTTLEDMKHYGISLDIKKPLPTTFDIKTLYEQTTMYCDLIATSSDYQYNIEIYQQPNTPIKIFVYWSKELHKITSINITCKGE